jgi:hypothetical protein
MARGGAHMTYSCLCPGGPLSCVFFSYCFSGKNRNARKSLGQFEIQKVLETSKYTKQVFPVLQSYNQNKRDRYKIPTNQEKHDYNII